MVKKLSPPIKAVRHSSVQLAASCAEKSAAEALPGS
jgi:hypothetical protein